MIGSVLLILTLSAFVRGFFGFGFSAVAALTHGIAGTITGNTLTQPLYSAVPVVLALFAGITLARLTNQGKLHLLYAVGLGGVGFYILFPALL